MEWEGIPWPFYLLIHARIVKKKKNISHPMHVSVRASKEKKKKSPAFNLGCHQCRGLM